MFSWVRERTALNETVVIKPYKLFFDVLVSVIRCPSIATSYRAFGQKIVMGKIRLFPSLKNVLQSYCLFL